MKMKVWCNQSLAPSLHQGWKAPKPSSLSPNHPSARLSSCSPFDANNWLFKISDFDGMCLCWTYGWCKAADLYRAVMEPFLFQTKDKHIVPVATFCIRLQAVIVNGDELSCGWWNCSPNQQNPSRTWTKWRNTNIDSTSCIWVMRVKYGHVIYFLMTAEEWKCLACTICGPGCHPELVSYPQDVRWYHQMLVHWTDTPPSALNRIISRTWSQESQWQARMRSPMTSTVFPHLDIKHNRLKHVTMLSMKLDLIFVWTLWKFLGSKCVVRIKF